MEALCARGDAGCEMRVVWGALHSLHLYCACVAAAILCCCARRHTNREEIQWRGQNARGVASLLIGVAWCTDAAAAGLRSSETVRMASSIIALFAWVAASAMHVALWIRRSAGPLLYLAIYWFLAAISSAAILCQKFMTSVAPNHVDVYIQTVSLLLSLVIAGVDSECFYDEITKRFKLLQKATTEPLHDITYKHSEAHFFSKITFFWINKTLYKGYESPLEEEDLGELPKNERSRKHYEKFKKIYYYQKKTKAGHRNSPSMWRTYLRMVWPNFYIAGFMKLFSDMLSVVPPLGLAVIIQYIENPIREGYGTPITFGEFFTNGYIMLLIVTLALIGQALLSQNATHLVTVEGTRIKTALQEMVYDKCMRLAPWSSPENVEDEDSPLLLSCEKSMNSQTGLLTNLMSQDTYNVMSCVWICHYIWAVPLKVAVILYLLYTKLGISALCGSAASILFITPLQFYIGKKISDNSKDITKCTDNRISKMTEILQGINIIKLYVWEDLFKEKILNLREVELKLLNKDSMYWSFLTFTTQISTILVTMITFIVYYYLGTSEGLNAVNVFAGLALFNQLSIPLLILPVTVLMIIQAMVSTKRIKDFLDLPESNNVIEDDDCYRKSKLSDKFNVAFIGKIPEKTSADLDETGDEEIIAEVENEDQFAYNEAPNENRQEILLKFRNAAFSWSNKSDVFIEAEDIDIPAGKFVMVVGATGSGKSSFLSAILGEMHLVCGEVNGKCCSMWYAGQPPWLLEGTVKENIVLDSTWCQTRYTQVLRATGLQPDLKLLPDGDATILGSHGTPLSGGQRVRVCVARALYSDARLLAFDEPLGALDASLARHIVARGLVPAARAGRTVVVATNRLELLHYADLIIAMEDGRVSGYGRMGDGCIAQWTQLAREARESAARCGAGPPGGTARERTCLVRQLSRARYQRCYTEDNVLGINSATGSHFLAEVPTYSSGSWRRATLRPRPSLARQLSSPPNSMQRPKWRISREVRRTVSADESNTALKREASLLRRLMPTRPHRTLSRWTPRSIRRLISADAADTTVELNRSNGITDESMLESAYSSLTSNGMTPSASITLEKTYEPEHDKEVQEPEISEWTIWYVYGRACGWWSVKYWVAAVGAQALALAADWWLARLTEHNTRRPLTDQQMWDGVRVYALWCFGGAVVAGAAQALLARGGAAGRRGLHDGLLRATLRASLHHHHATPTGTMLHRFAADILVLDKKLPIAVSRWAQLLLLCLAATMVNAVVAPITLLAVLPAIVFYFTLQAVYLYNARELQHCEASSAGTLVSLACSTSAGAGTIRAGRLQARMRQSFEKRVDVNHNALLLLNAANRWLGLGLDLVGATTVLVSVGMALYGGHSGAVAGLAGAYSLLLPTYLAHLAKCRADLHMHLAAVERVWSDSQVPQEDYREDCPIPTNWQRNGKMEFQNVDIQGEPNGQLILSDVNISINPGEKIAICGRSGSGKSTLLLSCAGATSIQNGRILIDEQDLTQVPLRALRHRVLILPQEATMFSGTLRENLDPLSVHTDEEMWQSLRAVGLYDFVNAQPAGLECWVSKTRCGCRGWTVGRAARVHAARAVLRANMASALLLDEPAAALDAPAERALLAALAAAAPDTTILTVSHRISSIRNYDRAIVLDEGKVVEQGEVRTLLSQPTSRLSRMLAAAQRQT